MKPRYLRPFEAFQEGHRTGYEHYVRNEGGNLFNYILGKTEDRVVAKDLGNRVFRFCFDNRQLFRDEAELVASLFAIARGFCDGFHLGQKARDERNCAFGPVECGAEADLRRKVKAAGEYSVYDDPDWARAEVIGRLRQSFRRLTPLKRRVLIYYYRRGMATIEVASRLKIKTQTALNHKSQALKKLKRLLGPDWEKIIPLLYS